MTFQLTPVQLVSFVLSFVLIGLAIYVMRIKPGKDLEYLPWLIWFVHTSLFYGLLAIRFEPVLGSFTEWGAILRLHGYLTIGYHLVYKVVQHYDNR